MQELDFMHSQLELAGTIRAWDETTASNQVTFGVNIERPVPRICEYRSGPKCSPYGLIQRRCKSRKIKSGIVFQRASWKMISLLR